MVVPWLPMVATCTIHVSLDPSLQSRGVRIWLHMMTSAGGMGSFLTWSCIIAGSQKGEGEGGRGVY